MNNITLICSSHVEYENCNPIELFKIIEIIKPEIIFEEIPYDRYDKYYKYKSAYTLETDAINMYLEKYNVIHIPVDTYEFSDEIQGKINFMYKTISENNSDYTKLVKKQFLATIQNGFSFLNSDLFDDLIEEIHSIEKNTLKLINDNELFNIYNKWMEITNSRENEILNNIYKYSKEKEYNNAILVIGAEHGKSILNKVKEYNFKENIEINWRSWRIA